ncbi:MAG: glycosyltransferase family 4 protein [Thermodesulfobacteriota bacterium]|nr:glycosyltransferase family 4 protein [Thermodesulfobacteriota bacterium]
MKKICFLIYGNLDRISGGYLYDKKLVEHFKNNGLHVCVIGIPERSFLLNIFWNFWFIFYLAKKNFDIIIEDEMIYPSIFLYNFWIKRRKKTKMVMIVHLLKWVELQDHWYYKIFQILERLMLNPANLIIANSEHTKQSIINMGISSEVIKVVYPGFDFPFSKIQKNQKKDDTIKLLFVANCIERKGLDILIEAIHSLHNPSLFLDVVGNDAIEPSYCKKVRKKIERYGLTDHVTFWGKVAWEEVGRYYANADIFVVPSLYEPYGMVFAEAMSYRLPIIATHTGGIPEIVYDNENGILVPPKDVGALANALSILAKDKPLRNLLGRRGYERSKHLPPWSKTADSVCNFIANLYKNGLSNVP